MVLKAILTAPFSFNIKQVRPNQKKCFFLFSEGTYVLICLPTRRGTSFTFEIASYLYKELKNTRKATVGRGWIPRQVTGRGQKYAKLRSSGM